MQATIRTPMDAQRLISQRRFFAISTTPARGHGDPQGPYLANQQKLQAEGRTVRSVTPQLRDAALFDVPAADAVLREHPRYCVFQAVTVHDMEAAGDAADAD